VELFIITVNLSFVTYLFIIQMINLILTSTDTQSTTFHISTLWQVSLHETSITPPLFFIEVSVPSQESERSYICVRDIEFACFYYIFRLDFVTVFLRQQYSKTLSIQSV
jgi:hypothetical protein